MKPHRLEIIEHVSEVEYRFAVDRGGLLDATVQRMLRKLAEHTDKQPREITISIAVEP